MSTFRPSYAGIAEMLNAPWMAAEMGRRAEAGKAFAEGVAPYDVDSKDGTHYRESFSTSSGVGGGAKADRAYGRLENDDDAAFFLEVGTKNNAAHHILGRALDIMAAE